MTKLAGRVLIAMLMALGALVCNVAAGLEISVVGLFPNKAVVQIDGGALQTLSVGQKTREGIILLSVGRDAATFDMRGQRVSLPLGPARRQQSPSAIEAVVVPSDASGIFIVEGHVNGRPIRFAVDTGATFIALSSSEAKRLGLAYRNGQRIVMKTANGGISAYRVKLDTVGVGNVSVHQVDAVITEGDGLPIALLGMSFLNRMEIRHEGAIMTLTKRD
jgi:aspartyl protease family protein